MIKTYTRQNLYFSGTWRAIKCHYHKKKPRQLSNFPKTDRYSSRSAGRFDIVDLEGGKGHKCGWKCGGAPTSHCQPHDARATLPGAGSTFRNTQLQLPEAHLDLHSKTKHQAPPNHHDCSFCLQKPFSRTNQINTTKMVSFRLRPSPARVANSPPAASSRVYCTDRPTSTAPVDIHRHGLRPRQLHLLPRRPQLPGRVCRKGGRERWHLHRHPV